MVEADIASSPEFKEFESKHNRHLNMMAENVGFFNIVKMNLGQEPAQISIGRVQQSSQQWEIISSDTVFL